MKFPKLPSFLNKLSRIWRKIKMKMGDFYNFPVESSSLGRRSRRKNSEGRRMFFFHVGISISVEEISRVNTG